MPEEDRNTLWTKIDDEMETQLGEVRTAEGGISRADAARKLLGLGYLRWKEEREWLEERRRQQAEAVG